MSGTTAVALGIDGSVRLLGEVSHIDRTLSRLFLQGSPSVCRPSEIKVATYVAEAVKTLLGSTARVIGFQSVAPSARQLSGLLVIHLFANGVKFRGSLVAVVHDQYRHIVVFALIVEVVDRRGHNVAVDDRGTAHEVHAVACE